MEPNTIITLGTYFEKFVHERISEGRFKNADEVIRAALRLLEEEENKRISLKSSIEEGIESRFAENFVAEDHLIYLKQEKRKNG